MLPAYFKAMWRKLVFLVALLALIAGLVLWPARHALIPLWPAPVEEVLSITADGKVCRAFVDALGDEPPGCGQSIARDRPLSLLCLEFHDGGIECGFPLGTRSAPESSLGEGLPEWVQVPFSEPASDATGILVLSDAADEHLEFSVDDIRRAKRPNFMSQRERIALTWQRLSEAMGERMDDFGVVVSVWSREET